VPSARLERKSPRDAAAAIRTAVGWLTANGYQSEPIVYGSAQLGYSTRTGDRFDQQPHTLRIIHQGAMIIFEFTTGLGSSGGVSGGDLQALEARVDAALGLKPAPAPMVGCRYCGRLTDASAVTCEGCGLADFV